MNSATRTRASAAIIAAGVMSCVGADQAQSCERLHLALTERPLNGVVTEVDFEGRDSVGDLMTWSNDVYDETNSTVQGRDNGWCIRTVVGRAWECTWTIALANGQIMASGTAIDDDDFVLAVIGGTGAYLGVTGQMEFKRRGGAYGLNAMVYDLRRCPL